MPVVPLVARWTNRWTWRSPSGNVRRLLAFARAERNTRIELEQAANLTPDPSRAAAYLQHASDEARHARSFVGHAKRLVREHGLPPVAMPHSDTSHLFATLGEVDFLAFVHHGEGRARQQFVTYREHLATTDPRGSAMFDAILSDEERHEAYSGALLAQVGDAAAVRRARMWEAWRWIRSLQRGTAQTLFAVGFLLLIPVLASAALWVRWMRPSRQGW